MGGIFLEQENVQETLRKLDTDSVELIELHFSDLHGVMKSIAITVDKAESALTKGVWFDGSSIRGFARICESDMFLKPDPNTYALIPWRKEWHAARFLCDIFTPKSVPFEGSPRNILKNACIEAEKLGYEYMTGPELEFFLFKQGENGDHLLHDAGSYFDLTEDLGSEVRKDVMIAMKEFNIEAERAHHEVAQSQHEIGFKYDAAVKSADNTLTMKYIIKSIASQHELIASFMPKPLQGINGSGMHVHQSLFDKKTGENVFFDEKDERNLSSTAKHFIAGQLRHAKALAAIVSPTVNSYKRLVPGYEAPVYICWASNNRSALIRIPRVHAGEKKSARCELRCPDPSANPYLAFAAMLHAGLDGIQKKMEAPAPAEENVYKLTQYDLANKNIDTLPASLGRALHELEEDEIVLNALGKHASQIYLEVKKQEWEEYKLQVTKWERERYLKTL